MSTTVNTHKLSSFNCDINEHLFIEASAGTGKTYTIEHLLVRRLITPLKNGQWVSMRNIAITTFTRACSLELSSRIYDTLKETVSLLDNEMYHELPSYFTPFLDSSVIQQIKKRLKLALFEFDDSTISTIHGFSKRVLAEYYQLDPSFQQATWLDRKTMEDLVRNFFYLKEFQNHFHEEEMKIILLQNNLSFKEMVEKIASTLLKKKFSQPIVNTSEIFKKLKEEALLIKEEYTLTEEKVFDSLINESVNFNGLRTKNGDLKSYVTSSFVTFSKMFNDVCEKEQEASLIKAYPFSKLFEEEKKKGKKEDPILLPIFIQKLFPLLDQIQDSANIFSRLLSTIQNFLTQEMRRWGYLVPDDLLLQMQEATSDPSFCNFMRTKFLAVFIDEFQDTDPIQWEIISNLFSKNENWEGSLFLVGDPKQAIYSFRNADVYSYMSARDEKIFQRLTLDTNFRSSNSLVAALNLLFASTHSKFSFFLPKLSLSYQAEALNSSDKYEDCSIKSPITFFSLKSSLGRKKNWPHEEAESLLLIFIYKEILFLNANGINIQDCAILVKDRFQGERVEQFLKAHKINCQSLRKNSIGNSEAHAFLKRLFLAIRNPKDLSSLMHLLLLNPFFIEEAEHQKLKSDDEESLKYRASYVENLISLRSTFDERGISNFAEKFFSTTWGHETSLEKVWRSHEDLYTDLEHLFDLLIQEELKQPLSLEACIEYLKILETESHFDDDKTAVRRVRKSDSVPILTMHKSKGLEFDVVFALGVASRTPLDVDELSSKEVDAEKIRLLYVAATRAKKLLYLPLLLEEDEKKVPVGTSSPLELFLTYLSLSLQDKATSHLINIRENLYEEINQEALLDAVNFLEKEGKNSLITQVDVSCDKEEVIVEDKWQQETSLITTISPMPPNPSIFISSFSKKKQLKKEHAVQQDISEKTIPLGKETGILIHEIIQELILNPENLSEDNFSVFLQSRLLNTILSDYEDELRKILHNLFNCKFSTDTISFSLKEISLSNCFCERDFIYQEKENSFVQGTFDFAFKYKDSYFLIDWKTNYLGNDELSYSHDALFECIKREEYDLQAEIYITSFNHYLAAYSFKCGGIFFVFLRGLNSSTSDGIIFLEQEKLLKR